MQTKLSQRKLETLFSVHKLYQFAHRSRDSRMRQPSSPISIRNANNQAAGLSERTE